MLNYEMYTIWDIHTDEDKEELIRYLHTDDDSMDTSQSYRILQDILKRLTDFSAVIEEYYVDKIYRDSYYYYYSAKHFNFDRNCKRVTLFSMCFENQGKTFHDYSKEDLQEHFLGSIVIRPIPGHIVGRTLLNPDCFFDRNLTGYIRLARFEMTVLGKELSVDAFPYSMQDGETTSCAETSLLNLLEYYCQSYPEYRSFLPSDITKIVSNHLYERVLPTKGLTFDMISRVLCEAGFNPVVYSTKNMDAFILKRMICNYIESGIPLIIGVDIPSVKAQSHAMVMIGHVLSSATAFQCKTLTLNKTGENFYVYDTTDSIDTFIVMDDNAAPYQVMKMRIEYEDKKKDRLMIGKYKINTVIVPLYKRMILEAVNAFDVFMNVLSNEPLRMNSITELYREENLINEYPSEFKSLGTDGNPFVVRMYMASSKTFSRFRDQQFFFEKRTRTQYIYNTVPFPKFVWVCEISTQQLYEDHKIIGEMIVDATSSPEIKLESFILAHYPYVFVENNVYSENGMKSFDPEWKTYDLFNQNLKAFHET